MTLYNIKLISKQVWEYTLAELNHQMDSGANNDELPPMFHDRLHSALELMIDFFHADGQGLSTETLHSESFCMVEQRLQYHKMDTEGLIEIFYRQRLQEQLNITTSPYGSLAVRAYFNHDSLCVEVSNHNGIPMRSNRHVVVETLFARRELIELLVFIRSSSVAAKNFQTFIQTSWCYFDQ